MHSYHSHNNMDKRPMIMLVGKGITRDRITGRSDFSFTPCSKLLQRARRHDIWLDTKVVCSKPCHGMNLLSTELKDYLYNPCTGFRFVYHTRGTAAIYVPPNLPSWSIPEGHGHAFTLGRKNVGLGFNLSTQDHTIVEMFYHVKDFKSRQYYLTCMVTECGRRTVQECSLPPLPVSDMPPAYLTGVLYWMSDPRLGERAERAIVSFDITTCEFSVIPCPSCFAMWNNGSASNAFVVELGGTLCAVLADPDAEELNIWRREHDQWHSAYTVYLEGWPGYSLGANVVVPWAIDPKDGKILLNTGRKLGFYDPARRFIEICMILKRCCVSGVQSNPFVLESVEICTLPNTNIMVISSVHRSHFWCSTGFQMILRLLYLGTVLHAPAESNVWREEIHYILK